MEENHEKEYAKDLGFKCNVKVEAEKEDYYVDYEGYYFLDFEALSQDCKTIGKGNSKKTITDKIGKKTYQIVSTNLECKLKK